MAEVARLYPEERNGVGTYVAYSRSKWEVRDCADRVLSRHFSLLVAIDRCQWHSGTRFVHVQGIEKCWDSETREFVTWNEMLTTIMNRCKR